MTETSKNTAEFLQLFDRLFDTFNGIATRPTNGKFYRTALHEKSKHLAYWKEIVPVLESIQFISKAGTYL